MARTPLPTTSSPPSGPSSDENERYPHFMSARAGALSGGSTAYAPAHHPEVDEAGWSNEYLGIVLFIVSEAVMFGAFFAQYFYNRILAPEWPNPAGLPPGFERVPAFPLPVILTILLGAVFLAGQAYEYTQLIFHEGFSISSGIYGTVFFSLTGLHGLHVTAGVTVLIGVLIRAFMGHFSSRSHFGVEGSVLYWHFVDVVWLALYATLYA